VAKLNITLACWDYDRTRPLAEGLIQPDGISLNYLSLPVEETFFRMLRYREFEAAEMSLSSYTVSLQAKNPPFIAIPVFPSRFFRHSCIFVSNRSGIREPKDLIGRKMGVPEYQMTAPVWIRGILQDEYGVAPTAVDYYTGGEEEPGREPCRLRSGCTRFRPARRSPGCWLTGKSTHCSRQGPHRPWNPARRT
jgi:4,5-dihydroxyphthalate decarboxylase